MKRLIGEWIIGTCWLAEFEDHQDGTCTLLSYYRPISRELNEEEKSCPKVNTKLIIESKDGKRTAEYVNTGNGIFLKIRNPNYIFSYKMIEKGKEGERE